MNEHSPSQTAEILHHVDAIANSAPSNASYFSQLLQLMTSVVGDDSGHLWQPAGDEIEPMVRVGDEGEWTKQERAVALEVSRTLAPTIFCLDPVSYTDSIAYCLSVPIALQQQCVAVASLNTPASSPQIADAYLAILAAMTERIGKSYILNEYGRTSRELVTRIKA